MLVLCTHIVVPISMMCQIFYASMQDNISMEDDILSTEYMVTIFVDPYTEICPLFNMTQGTI